MTEVNPARLMRLYSEIIEREKDELNTLCELEDGVVDDLILSKCKWMSKMRRELAELEAEYGRNS